MWVFKFWESKIEKIVNYHKPQPQIMQTKILIIFNF